MLAPIWFDIGVAWDKTHVHINNMSITPPTTNNTKINGVNNGTRNSNNGKRKTKIGPVLFNGTVGTSSTKPESRQNLCRIPAEPQFGRFLARISAEPVHHPHFSGLNKISTKHSRQFQKQRQHNFNNTNIELLLKSYQMLSISFLLKFGQQVDFTK